jgi:hypothetical protein
MNDADAEWVYIAYLTIKGYPLSDEKTENMTRVRTLDALERLLVKHGYDFNSSLSEGTCG